LTNFLAIEKILLFTVLINRINLSIQQDDYEKFFNLNIYVKIMVQLVFSSATLDAVSILSKRGVEGVSKILLFDVWYYDETKRKLKEGIVEEVRKYLESMKMDYTLTYLDTSQEFYNVIINIVPKIQCREAIEFYLVSREDVMNLAFFYFALLCRQMYKKVRIFDGGGKEILNRLPEKVSEAQFEVMKMLREEKEVEELTKSLGKSLSTLSKQISTLEGKGLVSCTATRPKKCRLTELGKILLAISGYRKV